MNCCNLSKANAILNLSINKQHLAFAVFILCLNHKLSCLNSKCKQTYDSGVVVHV